MVGKILKGEIVSWLEAVLMYTPGRFGFVLRTAYLKRRGVRVGRNLRIDTGVLVTGHRNIKLGDNVTVMRYSSLASHDGRLEIGNNVSINSNTHLGAADRGSIIIGNNVLIAQNVVLRASDHEHGANDIPIIEQGHTGGTIVIEDDVWICANVVVTRNVSIGAHSIVGAGAVVTKHVEPYSFVAGVPARLISRRVGKGSMDIG